MYKINMWNAVVLDDITIEMYETVGRTLVGLPGQIKGMGRLCIDAYMYILTAIRQKTETVRAMVTSLVALHR